MLDWRIEPQISFKISEWSYTKSLVLIRIIEVLSAPPTWTFALKAVLIGRHHMPEALQGPCQFSPYGLPCRHLQLHAASH